MKNGKKKISFKLPAEMTLILMIALLLVPSGFAIAKSLSKKESAPTPIVVAANPSSVADPH